MRCGPHRQNIQPFLGEYNAGAPTFAAVIAFMDNVGFAPYDIMEMHRLQTLLSKPLVQIDFLFVRKTSPIARRVQAAIAASGAKAA